MYIVIILYRRSAEKTLARAIRRDVFSSTNLGNYKVPGLDLTRSNKKRQETLISRFAHPSPQTGFPKSSCQVGPASPNPRFPILFDLTPRRYNICMHHSPPLASHIGTSAIYTPTTAENSRFNYGQPVARLEYQDCQQCPAPSTITPFTIKAVAYLYTPKS
ncbi:hypothetical protein MFRU_003g01390 [Monilinia fructicola]|nr:hypothetical protein MFRU_003g01390 [Monilinia fructicola]